MIYTLQTTIPFQGFYGSIHEGEIDQAVEYETEYAYEQDEATPEDVDKWYSSIEFQAIFLSYSQEYVSWLKQELDIPSLMFKKLDSPREYNFTTDRIFCEIGYEAVKELYDLYKDSEGFKALLEATFTSYDGFMSFYSNDVTVWLAKPLATWDINEVGLLVQYHFNVLEIDECDSLEATRESIGELLPLIETKESLTG